MNPDTLLLLSGGIDSAYCMWRALSEGRSLHVHHVHLTNHEGRLQYEARAVERILKWMRGRGLTNFRYTENPLGMGTLGWIPKDHCFWAQFIGTICANPKNRHITRVIRPDHWDSVPGGPDSPAMKQADRRYRNISYEICERELIWEHPIQRMMKAEVVHAMPRDLLELCWYCRRPTHRGKPCHRCYTCRLVDAALRGGPLMYEARVIHPFRDKHTKARYTPGDTYRHRSKARMEYLAGLPTPRVEWPPGSGEVGEPEAGAGEAAPQAGTREETPEPRHVGGGWYELPGGQRVKGKDAALAALGGAAQ